MGVSRARLASLAALILSAPACAVDLEAPVGTRAGEIVNGRDNPGDQAVVALLFEGEPYCSGTLVGRRIVVTAAHCLPPVVQASPQRIDVFFGPRTDDPGTILAAAVAEAHPSWSDGALGYDVGAIALAVDAPVAPVPLTHRRFSAIAAVGDTVRVIGYGAAEVEGGGGGIKRAGEMTIDDYDGFTIFLSPGPSATCSGDSGGPLFADDGAGGEVFAGIHSRSDCEIGSMNERLDAHLEEFVLPFMREYGHASCEEDLLCASSCNAPDPDCPCAEDGFCDGSCSLPETDPDCLAGCGDNGACVPGCAADPDCVACGADGACEEGCAEDPDCGASAGTGGGCAAGGGSAGSSVALLLLLALAAWRRTT